MTRPAARLHDPIDHSHALGGLIAGAVIGGLVATAVVLTAPVSVPVLIGGAAIAGAAVGGAGVGELLGSLSPAMHRTGEVDRPGAPDVWVNARAAARAHLDHVACDDHGVAPVIAEGSDSVSVNGQPFARKNDHTACDAVIADGSPNVHVGGGTATTDAISPEVPGYVHTAMLAVGLASAAILAGPAVAVAGLVGGIAGGKLGSALGGAWFGEGLDGQKLLGFGGSVLGGGLAAKGVAGSGSTPAAVAAGDAGAEALGAAGAAEDAGAASADAGRGTYFFDKDVLPYIDRPDATLARAGEAHFFMPSEDSSVVTDAGNAYRYTGGAPSLERAYTSGGDVYGVDFPLDGMSPRPPTAADTNLPHYLEGGQTALRLGDGGGYLLNPTHELVVPGGGDMPIGANMFKINPDGSRSVMRSW